MKSNNSNLLIDLFRILPNNFDCYIQSPSLENDFIKNLLQKTGDDFYNLVKINEANIESFILEEQKTSFSTYIQSIEIKINNILLFEGYDGMEYGILSNRIAVPEWFKLKYIPDTCSIATDW